MHKKFLATILTLAMLIFAATANAAILKFEGVGEHYMENQTETLDDSKNKAKIVAELNALEQAQINIQSYSESRNLNLTRDEIITITAGILNVTDVKYKLTNEGNILVMTAIITAEIDTDKIPELVEREIKRRANKN